MRTSSHFARTQLRSFPAAATLLVWSALAFSPHSPSLAQNPPQDQPLDASEISRDLLYLAPSHEERRVAGDVNSTAYVGARFEYMPTNEKEWFIKPTASNTAEPAEKKRVTAVEEFELVGASDDDRATLALRKKGAQEVLASATLWDRDQLVEAWLPQLRKEKRGLTADGLRQDLEIADPEVRSITRIPSVNKPAIDSAIFAAVGQSTGEMELGLATIVKFEPDNHAVTVYHPAAQSTCEVSTIGQNLDPAKNTFILWFGMRRFREGAIAPCGGLSRLDPQTRAVVTASGVRNPPIGSIVTMMGSGAFGTIDVATDAGICRLVYKTDDHWNCWRFVPTATLKEETPIANRPGDKPYGNLKAGDCEVLWANQNFLEVATPDSYDAYLAADDYAEAAARNFDVEPYKLLNTASGGATPIRPLAKPNGEPLNGALVYRAPLEKLTAPAGTPAGWVKVRGRVGWIAREKLEVVPKLVPTQK